MTEEEAREYIGRYVSVTSRKGYTVQGRVFNVELPGDASPDPQAMYIEDEDGFPCSMRLVDVEALSLIDGPIAEAKKE